MDEAENLGGCSSWRMSSGEFASGCPVNAQLATNVASAAFVTKRLWTIGTSTPGGLGKTGKTFVVRGVHDVKSALQTNHE